MNVKPLAACALALLFALTALSTPVAEARVCHPRVRIDVETYGEVPVPREAEVEYPPHWDRFAFAQNTKLEGGYSNGCVEAGGSVGGVEVGTAPLGNGFALQADGDGDGIGDAWMAAWDLTVQQVVDYDGDDLLLVDEFRWQRNPTCPDTEECLPPLLGDGWLDGAEVTYWNNVQNDALNPGAGVAVYDPDRLIDTDGDLASNVNDTDSDDDGLIDGEEIHAYGTYPEYPDSDCDAAATQCKPSRETRFFDAKPDGPGTGDLLDDADEAAYWDTVSGSAWVTNYDGDGITNNLLDADADGDTLVDGEEVTHWHTKPYLLDSDLDGLEDGDEVRAYHTDPALWDTDGDGMPDGWEADANLNPLADDAALDNDADALPNLGEYTYARPGGWSEATQGPWAGGTNPSDPDTEGDAVFDGVEVLDHTTDPFHWDTDLDGMADFFEVTYASDPLDAGDASIDADSDSFDQGNDGSIQKPWPNLDEYRYGRPAAWDETAVGPWRGGTDPQNIDTDGDGAGDGMEAFHGTDARVPADVLADDDGDGLSWAEEARLGINPSDPDTDGDGLCDGGRGVNCHFPEMGSLGSMPGEADYGSVPWEIDSDSDGRLDDKEALKWDPGASGSAQDVDGDRVNGVVDSDSDNDGLLDGDEYARTTDMSVQDTDTDGLGDGDEVRQSATDPKDADHDDDGLLDGEEVTVHRTRAKWWDTDGDGLGDGDEAKVHGTDPLLQDTDGDAMHDHWEATRGTLPRTRDAEVDLDNDTLSNLQEHGLGSLPRRVDSDGDGLPDGYEAEHDLGISVWSRGGDPDGDSFLNINEYNAKTHPRVFDTDGDGLGDGWEEFTAGTDPLDRDTDKDGLKDGREHDAWTAEGYPWSTDTDGDTLKPLLDVDSDNDGLNDRDELVHAKTKPHVPDTDDDGLSDYQEVVVYGGQYDPHRADTDRDGQGDALEVALADKNADPDNDGLSTGVEEGYGSDPTKPDTDCDGIQDGPEFNHWGSATNLRVADADGDGVKDGLELGVVGTSPALYRTDPGVADTDGDGIADGGEARNNAKIVCGDPQASMSFQGPAIPTAPPGPVPSLLAGLARTSLGLYVGQDAQGWYVQGGYGVRLRLDDAPPSADTPEEVAQALARPMGADGAAVGTNGKTTDPTVHDTDGDGLGDGSELLTHGTDPVACDTDLDGLGDGLERGVTADVSAPRRDTKPECQQRDWHPGSKTSPLSADSDGDGLADGWTLTDGAGNVRLGEDPNLNGLPEPGSEGDPTKVDSDSDGLTDAAEARALGILRCVLKPDCDDDLLADGAEVSWDVNFDEDADVNFVDRDSDGDGLDDGLEPSPAADFDLDGARNMVDTDLDNDYLPDGPEAKFAALGTGLGVSDADSDGDGVLDGLDLNPVLGGSLLGLDLDRVLVKDPVDVATCSPDFWNYGCEYEAEIFISRIRVTTGRDGSGEILTLDATNAGEILGEGRSVSTSKSGKLDDFGGLVDIGIEQDITHYGGPELSAKGLVFYVWLSTHDRDLDGDDNDKLDIGGDADQGTPVWGHDNKDYRKEVNLARDPASEDFWRLEDIDGEMDGSKGAWLDEDDVSLTAKLFERVPNGSLTLLLESSCQLHPGAPTCKGSPAPR